jgi:hypothetical protein
VYFPPGCSTYWGRRRYPQRSSVVLGWSAREPIAYWIALHELGHQALDHPTRYGFTPSSTILREECDAWDWAFDASPVPPGERSIKYIETCLRAYMDVYPGHRHKTKVGALLTRISNS